MTIRRLLQSSLSAVLLFAALNLSAATSEFRVLFDTDNNATTGCTVGDVSGIEQVLVTQVTHDETTATVTKTFRQVCSGGTLGAAIDEDSSGWPGTLNAASGVMTVESRIPFTAFAPSGLPPVMRLSFEATSGSSNQFLRTNANGGVIVFPPDGPKHRAVGSGGARTFVLDGLMTDWGAIGPMAFRDPGNDSGFEFRKAWAFANAGDQFIYLSFESRIGSGSGPTANPDTYERNQGSSLAVNAAKGVLKNDVDPNGEPLTATKVADPANGTVTLNPDGSFTYVPNVPSSTGNDQFEYKASNSTTSSNAAKVTITVNEKPKVNDNLFTIPENSPNGTVVGEVTVSDDTTSGRVFAIISGNTGGAFSISTTAQGRGKIVVANSAALNFETTPTFSLTVRVTDEGGLSDNGSVTVVLTNMNDAPVATNSTQTVLEDQVLNVPAPGLFSNVTDEDANTLTLSVVSNPSNGVLVLNPDGSYSYDSNPHFFGTDSFTWRAWDGTVFSNTATVTITVTPVNDQPSFTAGGNVSSPADLAYSGAWASAMSAGPANESTQTFTFVVTNTNNALFSVQPAIAPDGTLTFTPAGNALGSVTVTVHLQDNGGTANGGVDLSAPANFQITITCPTIAVTNPATTTATAGTPFSQTFTQTGAIGSTTFTLASGVLPAGLTLATNGNLAGTPTQTGSFPITVTVTDSASCTATGATYTLVVGCPTITVTNPVTTSGTANSAFSQTFTQTGAVGSATFTTASTLPAGLTLATSGLLSGTPTQTGTFPIVVTVTDANGCTGTSATYSLVINCQTITVTNPANANGTASAAFSETFTQSGSIGGATFTTASTLPAGLTLATNGVLSGTPTQTGTFPIVVTVTDANGCTGTSATYTLVIGCQTITVNNPANANGTAASPFSETFTQTAAIGTATFTTSSTLPAGLTLAANGVLSGTPTQTGSFPIVVTVTDANGCTGTSATYTLFIACQTINVSNPANTNGTAASPFSETFTQTGAIGTATFTTASTLPAGLTLAANGVLSGTPTQTGSFPIVVTVTDANGCTGTSATYTLVIACQTITVTNPANTNGTAASPFSETFTQSGSIGTATFTTASALPAGLTLATNGVLSGTPTQTGSFPIVVTVTDANGCTGTSATYTLVIACQTISVLNPANATGPAGSPFSETFTQTGAIGTATFTTASTLPTGMTLAANGVLSGTPTQGGTFPIVVTVTDANGCTGTSATYNLIITCPVITVTNPANANGTAGSAFSETFTSAGGLGTMTYTLASGTLPAGLTLAANGVLSGTPTQTGSFPITVTATDQNGCTGTGATYTIVIACQTITVNNPANANGTANAPFSETVTHTSGIGTVTFTLASGTLPAGLTLAANGVVSGTPTQTGSFPITVTATDANGCTGTSATYTIVIACQTITVNSPANTNGAANAAFSETFTQTNGIGTITYTLASGTLPAGLTLASNGVLSGTPTQTGSFPITVTATDANGCTGTSATYTIIIGCQTITVTNPANASGTAGAAFSETFTQAGAIGSATFTLASGTLPAGLTLAANGVLSGTPTQTGSFPITVTVTDANGCTGTSATYTLVIACQTISVLNPANATGPAGSPFSETFTQTGAIGSATFTLASGTLPTGLTLAANGVLSGTPTQGGSFPITVTVTDANGCTGTSGTYTLVITCPVITVNNPANANGTANAAFSETFTQTGGQGTITYTLASGTLPAGLTLAANGVLSGTPTQTGSFPITVTATDQNGCTGTGATYTIVIACQTITVNSPANANGTANSAFSETFTQTNAIGSVSYSLASGTLPAGLTLAANGVLSGIPTQTGSFPITVTVTDANGCTGTSATYTIIIGCQVITVTNPANAAGTINVAFSETFTQSGAIGSATFTTGSTLPNGMALATNGVLSGTPTQTGTFPIVITVTDANGCTGTSATYNLVIACQTITVTNPANANGTVGTVFSETFTQVGSNGTATFTTASTLPAGLSLSTAGVLSGTPTQAGAFPIVVTVTDSNGCTGTSATYNLVIACQTITVNNPATTTGTVDAAFSQTFTNTGAIGTVTYTLASGTLPSGLTLAANGTLSGTPGQPGSFPITVTVTDQNGCTGTSATYTLVIACQTITVTNPGVTTGTVDAAFSQTFTQVGVGTHTPITWSVTGALPSGITLNSSTGVLSGTPGQPGSFPITVTATDANGCAGTGATYTLVIACQTITVTNPGVTAATYNSAFSQTFTQSGVGTHTPAVWSVTGTLPTGVTLNSSTGVLSGTPTQTGTFPITVTVTDVNGCAGTGATYTLAVAPVANADSFANGVPNTQYVLTGGSTATPSTPSVQFAGTIESNDLPSAGSVTVVAGTFATTQGGSVNVAADGTFLYTPPVQSGVASIVSDTFTYTVTSNTGGTGPVTSAAATVTVNLSNRVWYVKNDSAAGGDGRSHLPFDTLAEAQTASTANDIIYVYFGNGTNSGQNAGFTMKAGQKLYGQGIALVVNSQTLVTAGTRSVIGNSAGDGVTATNLTGNIIRGLNITGSDDGISMSTSGAIAGDIEIADNTIHGSANHGVRIVANSSNNVNVSVHDNTLSGLVRAMDFQRTSGIVTITAFDDNVVPGSSGGGIVVAGVGGVVTFDTTPGGAIQPVPGGITVIGASGDGVGNGGLTLTNVVGTLNFTDLDVFATAGAALDVDGGVGGFTLTVTASVSTLEANAGAAASIVDVTGLDLQLAAMTSANSSANGVLLSNVTGTFSAPTGSSITNATGADFQISASDVAVTYGGTITDDQGQLITISSNTGTRTHAFTGAITDGDDGDGSGVTMSGNSAGTTVRFSGGLVLSTGSAAALSASGGGVLEICDENPCNLAATGALINKITTTTGTAVNINSTTIGGNGVELRSVSSNGAVNGISLNATGAGAFRVKGNSAGNCGGTVTTTLGSAPTVGAPSIADCTGGTIQASTSHGISIVDADNVSLTRMYILNSGVDGIFMQNVNGFTLDRSYVTDGAGVAGDRGIDVDFAAGTPVNGTVAVTNSTVGPTPHDNFGATVSSGTSTWTITNSVFTGSVLNSGFNFEVRGTSVISAMNITGSVFQSQFADGMQIQPNATSDATMTNVTIDDCAFQNNNIGADLNHDGTANVGFFVTNNTFLGHQAQPINLFSSAVQAPTTGDNLEATISNNRIGIAANFKSGSALGNGIRVNINGGADATVLVSGNTIRQAPNARGIEVISRNGTGGLDLTLTNNSVDTDYVVTAENGGFSLSNIFLQSNCLSVCNTLRADVRNNTVPGFAPTGELVAGQLVLIETGASTLNLVDSTAPISGTCASELAGTNTGNTNANAGCSLIAGPIAVP